MEEFLGNRIYKTLFYLSGDTETIFSGLPRFFRSAILLVADLFICDSCYPLVSPCAIQSGLDQDVLFLQLRIVDLFG